MTDTKHPISLQGVVFTRSVVLAMREYQAGEGPLVIEPDNKIKIEKVPDQVGVFSASMTMVLNPNKENSAPYSVEMECMALLRADDTLTEDEALRGVTITAHSVLYGAIREAVAWLTARQPYGPLMLGLSVLKSAPQKPADAKS